MKKITRLRWVNDQVVDDNNNMVSASIAGNLLIKNTTVSHKNSLVVVTENTAREYLDSIDGANAYLAENQISQTSDRTNKPVTVVILPLRM